MSRIHVLPRLVLAMWIITAYPAAARECTLVPFAETEEAFFFEFASAMQKFGATNWVKSDDDWYSASGTRLELYMSNTNGLLDGFSLLLRRPNEAEQAQFRDAVEDQLALLTQEPKQTVTALVERFLTASIRGSKSYGFFVGSIRVFVDGSSGHLGADFEKHICDDSPGPPTTSSWWPAPYWLRKMRSLRSGE